jgi:hypothetical protein
MLVKRWSLLLVKSPSSTYRWVPSRFAPVKSAPSVKAPRRSAPFEQRAAELSAAQVRPEQVGVEELGSFEIAAGEVDACHLALTEERQLGLTATEVRSFEVRAFERGTP